MLVHSFDSIHASNVNVGREYVYQGAGREGSAPIDHPQPPTGPHGLSNNVRAQRLRQASTGRIVLGDPYQMSVLGVWWSNHSLFAYWACLSLGKVLHGLGLTISTSSCPRPVIRQKCRYRFQSLLPPLGFTRHLFTAILQPSTAIAGFENSCLKLLRILDAVNATGCPMQHHAAFVRAFHPIIWIEWNRLAATELDAHW